jgi:hypothetical protein
VRPVSFDRKVVRQKRVRAIGDGQRLGEFLCKEFVVAALAASAAGVLAGVAITATPRCTSWAINSGSRALAIRIAQARTVAHQSTDFDMIPVCYRFRPQPSLRRPRGSRQHLAALPATVLAKTQSEGKSLWDEIREKLFKNYALKSIDAVRRKLEQAILYIEQPKPLNPFSSAAETCAMPAHQRLGPDSRYNWRKNRRSLLVNWTRPRT